MICHTFFHITIPLYIPCSFSHIIRISQNYNLFSYSLSLNHLIDIGFIKQITNPIYTDKIHLFSREELSYDCF